MNKVWTEAEREFIRQNADTMKDRELAERLTELVGRSVTCQAVRKQRQKLSIRKIPGRGRCGVALSNDNGDR